MKSHNTPIHILFCSRLVEEKGVDILLDVIRWSLEDFALDHIVWHIASDGLYEKQVEAVSQGSSGRVVYHGKMNQQELAELMRSADYLYMPSRFLETFWLTALESIACGVPVIGIKKGGLMDFIDDSLAIDENSLFFRTKLGGSYQKPFSEGGKNFSPPRLPTEDLRSRSLHWFSLPPSPTTRL